MVQTAPDIFIFWNFVQLHSFLYEIKVKVFFLLMLVIVLYENWDVSSLAACILVILGFVSLICRGCVQE